jgi:hypothetical protein
MAKLAGRQAKLAGRSGKSCLIVQAAVAAKVPRRRPLTG